MIPPSTSQQTAHLTINDYGKYQVTIKDGEATSFQLPYPSIDGVIGVLHRKNITKVHVDSTVKKQERMPLITSGIYIV